MTTLSVFSVPASMTHTREVRANGEIYFVAAESPDALAEAISTIKKDTTEIGTFFRECGERLCDRVTINPRRAVSHSGGSKGDNNA